MQTYKASCSIPSKPILFSILLVEQVPRKSTRNPILVCHVVLLIGNNNFLVDHTFFNIKKLNDYYT